MDKKNVRYNILIIFIYIIGIVLLIQLFNLQIVHGEEYLQKSSSRLTRETTILAARGDILDRNGNVLAGTITNYSLEIYKSKIDINTLNNTLLKVIQVLEANGDTYKDNFPIKLNPIEFTIDEEKLSNWLKNNELSEEITAEQVLQEYKEKYQIQNDNLEEIRKIISIRYGIEKEGYNSMSAYTISNNISLASVAIFEEQNLIFPGIAIKTAPIRTYSRGSLASHIIGYVGPINEEEYKNNSGYLMNDYIGKAGIEYVFEGYLRGKNGKKQTDMSIDGTTTAEYITEEAVQGSDIVLTIDANLQYVAENALKNNIEKIRNGGFGEVRNVQTGAVVVLDVKTGEVLALVSYPDFEPELFIKGISTEKWNEYTQKGKGALINRCIQSAYAPGSIFKMVSAIAGLETGAITRAETIYDTGIYPKGHNPRCWYYSSYGTGHGALNVSGAIKNSCNYFFYEVVTRMGIDNLEKYANYFGLGQKTNIELPGEVSGTLAGKTLYEKLGQTWYYGNSLSAVIGQAENNFTPLQIARYIAMITNEGKSIDISILKDIMSSDKSEQDKMNIQEYINNKLNITEINKETLKINKENIDVVLEGMKSVTTETGGTAYSVFKNFGIEVGGKTGSAEAGGKVNAWFAGFAPYENPEIAIVVMVEDGSHGYYTAEVAKEIIEQHFRLKEEANENVTAIPYTEQLN
ncbi:MAG: penicillin-binding transpeptidase domain-containing protein [Clostridia bacterium]|nr:penicillin-binding transpeptidase domain-containing protein [Clostridia bacterium]